MFFQMILKGIANDDDVWARHTLCESGILCRWWNRVGEIHPEEVKQRLTERNLMWHLSRYNRRDPLFNNDPFCDHSPFISTTASAVERGRNRGCRGQAKAEPDPPARKSRSRGGGVACGKEG